MFSQPVVFRITWRQCYTLLDTDILLLDSTLFTQCLSFRKGSINISKWYYKSYLNVSAVLTLAYVIYNGIACEDL
jgi:hypothetical protein